MDLHAVQVQVWTLRNCCCHLKIPSSRKHERSCTRSSFLTLPTFGHSLFVGGRRSFSPAFSFHPLSPTCVSHMSRGTTPIFPRVKVCQETDRQTDRRSRPAGSPASRRTGRQAGTQAGGDARTKKVVRASTQEPSWFCRES